MGKRSFNLYRLKKQGCSILHCNFKQKKQLQMKDLIDYQRFQVEALQKKVCELETKLNEVKTHIFELCEQDCTEEYKTIIKQKTYEL